jgi:tRNA(Ile)-lysidine synthase
VATTAVHQLRRAVLATFVESVEVAVVACSGGADSLALLVGASLARDQVNRGGRGLKLYSATIDHGLQPGSANIAQDAAAQALKCGVDKSFVISVAVRATGTGLEAAARTARYAALKDLVSELSKRHGVEGSAVIVLLGHTQDDQAETVLLGLTHGSGSRSLAGMPSSFDNFRRPLLSMTREITEQVCRERQLTWWQDPHNADRNFARARVRHQVLPVLEAELGPGVSAALARTATQLRADSEALDELAHQIFLTYNPIIGWSVPELERHPLALVSRVLRLAALAAGCPPRELHAVHIDGLVRQIHNRDKLPKVLQLPGQVRATRTGKLLRFDGGLDEGPDVTAQDRPV